MKLNIMTPNGESKGTVDAPTQFSETIRPDVIKRAVEALQANRRQPYGASPEAGKRASAELSRRRRKYRGSYGKGISRVPRKILSRRGTQMYMVGAFAPGTVGGRRAHPPKAEKIWEKKINISERRLAIRSAIAATIQKDIVEQRGHKLPAKYPFALSNDFESIDKTKQLITALEKLGLSDDLDRAENTSIRAGKGKLRGRKKRVPKSALLVVGADCKMLNSAQNIPGVDIIPVTKLNAELLAPGGEPGRLTLFTENALSTLKELFPKKKSAKLTVSEKVRTRAEKTPVRPKVPTIIKRVKELGRALRRK